MLIASPEDRMPHPFLVLCPQCGAEDSLTTAKCAVCRTPVTLTPGEIAVGNRRFSYPDYYRYLIQNLAVFPKRNNALDAPPNFKRTSGPATLHTGAKSFRFKGYRGWFRRRLWKGNRQYRGNLVILPECLRFVSGKKILAELPVEQLRLVTTSSHALLVRGKSNPPWEVSFARESALKYEILLRNWVDRYYSATGQQVVEYQPFLRTAHLNSPQRRWETWPAQTTPHRLNWLIRLVIPILKGAWRWLGPVQVSGMENWDSRENGVVVANHLSKIDPFVIGPAVDPRIAFLTKSLAFRNKGAAFFLKRAMGLPVRRFSGDPSAISLIRDFLQKGVKVGIFPEGERSWDGSLGSFKEGTVKLLMALGTPVFPIAVIGTFEVWPRWRKKPRRYPMEIRVCAPFCLLGEGVSVAEQTRFLEDYFRRELKAPSGRGEGPGKPESLRS